MTRRGLCRVPYRTAEDALMIRGGTTREEIRNGRIAMVRSGAYRGVETGRHVRVKLRGTAAQSINRTWVGGETRTMCGK